jgi:succinate-semialdehyde dehydrogenase/glutarate-semialdehyde dehydrogenase
MAVVDRPEIQNGVTKREQISVKNPVTGEEIGRIPVATADEVRGAVERARNTQPAWEALGVKERARLMRRWAELMWDGQTELIRVMRAETGKNDTGGWQEICVVDNAVNYYAQTAPGFLRPKSRRTLFPVKHRAKVYYKPYGVVGFITPWNYPLLNGFMDTVPALIAGNAIVIKPSEITPYTAEHVVNLMYEAGIPRDVVQIVHGGGSTGSALVDAADCISFTGSTAVGRKVAVRAAERLIPCCLELGGKDPLIVLNDADLDLAATGTLVGALENAGQACVSTERVYVEDGIYDRFLERVQHYVGQIVLDKSDGFDVHMGSLTNERELRRTEAHIADAVAKGAQVVYGGKPRPDIGPLFFEPTILVNVNHDMDVMREETFGPIVPIMRVKDADEAVRMANDSPYGLSSAIYTKDLRRGQQLATRVESGDVHLNCSQWVFGTPSLPMGGVKQSGLGRRNGREGLMRFVSPQSILTDNQMFETPKLVQGDSRIRTIYPLIRRMRKLLPFLPI